jgi:hypothetical protein
VTSISIRSPGQRASSAMPGRAGILPVRAVGVGWLGHNGSTAPLEFGSLLKIWTETLEFLDFSRAIKVL